MKSVRERVTEYSKGTIWTCSGGCFACGSGPAAGWEGGSDFPPQPYGPAARGLCGKDGSH